MRQLGKTLALFSKLGKGPVRAEEIVRELTRERSATEEPRYVLHGPRNGPPQPIVGKLNLKHRTIKVALDFENCEFLEDVDLRYCEFEQAVHFSSCVFRKNFDSGDQTESYTIYRKDLICDKTAFEGELNLRGASIEGSADFSEACISNGAIADFRMASIKKVLDCRKTTFTGQGLFRGLECNSVALFQETKFYSKNGIDFTLAVFGKNLDCVGAQFTGPATFRGLQCQGHGLFHRAKFADGAKVDFSYASFLGNLECDKAIFQGPADLRSIECKNLRCTNATFRKRVNFDSLQCHGSGWLSGAVFAGEDAAVFNGAIFNGDLNLRGSKFSGPAEFVRLRCTGNAWFSSLGAGEGNSTTVFQQEASFRYASLGVNLECEEVEFLGPVSFANLTCAVNGLFANARFGGEGVDFRYASFGGNLVWNTTNFEGPVTCFSMHCQALHSDIATFRRRVDFHSLKCDIEGYFRGARFEGDVDFRYASFGGDLDCRGTQTEFKRSVTFGSIRCQGSGRFDKVRFLSPFKPEGADFTFGHFGGDLSFAGAHFLGPCRLSMAHIERGLVFSNASFAQDVTLRGTNVGVLVIEGSKLPFKRASVDLREFNFQRFFGKRVTAGRLSQAQDPARFSRDPYLRLESYYRSIGDEVEAKKTHYRGRCELRENAKLPDERRGTQWAWPTRWSDWWIKWLTGYGVRTWRLLIPISLFLVIGTSVFWPNSALVRTGSDGTASEQHAITSPEQNRGAGEAVDNLGQHLFTRIAYSVDLFLPVVNLHVDQAWEPVGLGREIYAFFHSMVGWILVPLLLASLTGIIRRQ